MRVTVIKVAQTRERNIRRVLESGEAYLTLMISSVGFLVASEFTRLRAGVGTQIALVRFLPGVTPAVHL